MSITCIIFNLNIVIINENINDPYYKPTTITKFKPIDPINNNKEDTKNEDFEKMKKRLNYNSENYVN